MVITFFIGIGFYIICDLFYHIDEAVNDPENFFISNFGMDEMKPSDSAIKMLYWAFTSLSTVGFGDLHPRSDVERVVCAIILLFGVMIFSYVLGNFVEILNVFIDINEEVEDMEGLTKFFGLLEHYNRNQVLDQSLRENFEDFFSHKWKHDRQIAIYET